MERFFLCAETEGFEPSVPVRGRLVSSEVLSTTQPRLPPVESITAVALHKV
jgi:hypothetical protein